MPRRPVWSPRKIEAEAQRVLENSEVTEWPVALDKIAQRLGVAVEFVDFEDDLSGALIREADGGGVVGVNIHHHPNRRRFTIAHELGHFVLHGGTYVDKGTSVRFRGSKPGSGSVQEEREANQFAAALLMPEEWVRRAVAETHLDPATDVALQSLADAFGVSSLAMSYRLANLGLLSL